MAFCAAIATAVILGACGSGIPGNAVVQIGDATITKAALDHWLAVANDSNQVSTGDEGAAAAAAARLHGLRRAQRRRPAARPRRPSQIATCKATCAAQLPDAR